MGSARSVSATLGLPPSRRVCFPCLHCLGSRLLCWELSEASPGLRALPRSKPLRFRHSGSPQRLRLGWACVLCQVRAAQVTWCLLSMVAATYHLPRPCCCFLGVKLACLLRGMLTIQNPQKSWLAMKPACSLVGNASLGLRLPLLALAGLTCLSPEVDGPVRTGKPCSVFCPVSGPSSVLGLFVG